MKIFFIFLFLLASVISLPATARPGDTPFPDRAEGRAAENNHRCRDGGGYGQTVFIIPRVYIEYVGRSDCWSEIRTVEIPIDFLKLRDMAKTHGDSITPRFLSHGDLPDFFTWLLESGRYPMPGDALSGILGYLQGDDQMELYRLFRSFAVRNARTR